MARPTQETRNEGEYRAWRTKLRHEKPVPSTKKPPLTKEESDRVLTRTTPSDHEGEFPPDERCRLRDASQTVWANRRGWLT